MPDSTLCSTASGPCAGKLLSAIGMAWLSQPDNFFTEHKWLFCVLFCGSPSDLAVTLAALDSARL